jgi:hypothetical protein
VVWNGENWTPTANAFDAEDVTTPNSSLAGFGEGEATVDHTRPFQWIVVLG